jgi:hypothetical protein
MPSVPLNGQGAPPQRGPRPGLHGPRLDHGGPVIVCCCCRARAMAQHLVWQIRYAGAAASRERGHGDRRQQAQPCSSCSPKTAGAGVGGRARTRQRARADLDSAPSRRHTYWPLVQVRGEALKRGVSCPTATAHETPGASFSDRRLSAWPVEHPLIACTPILGQLTSGRAAAKQRTRRCHVGRGWWPRYSTSRESAASNADRRRPAA